MKQIKLDNFSMYIKEDDPGISRSLEKRARRLEKGVDPGLEREPAFTYIIRREINKLCENNKDVVFYDIGANIGLFTLIVADICKNNKYIIRAIEPDRNNCKILQENIILNKVNASVHLCALSKTTGSERFFQSNYSNLGSLIQHNKTGSKGIETFSYTLKDFINLHKDSPNFLKMDTEGGEVIILEGSIDYLISDECKNMKILMEVHPMFYTKERSLEKQLSILFENGWTCKYMVSAAVLVPDKFREAGLVPWKEFPTKGHSRAIYLDPPLDKVLDFACHIHKQIIPGKNKVSPKIVRSILIEKKINTVLTN